jgi:hypothetical protein
VKRIKCTSRVYPTVYALVDDDDFEFLIQWSWLVSPRGYPIRNNGKSKVFMHRVVMKARDGVQIDHINGIKHDNRRANLRFATCSQNAINRPGKKTRRYGAAFKGIFRCTETGKWRARIRIDNKNVNLGTHHTQEEAARAYDREAKKLFGEFAVLNFSEKRSRRSAS